MDIRLTGSYDAAKLYASGSQAASKATQTDQSSPDQSKVGAYQAKEQPAAVYEKSRETGQKATYSINKMSKEERAGIVSQLKAAQESNEKKLTDIVSKMMTGQANTLAKTDDMWSFLAKGNFTVTPEVKAQAQADIAEDGYWGVNETSKRLFDFASALAGDDEDMMREMESAMEKGFKEAMGEWGTDMPQLSMDTMEAARKLFSDFYAENSKETGVAVNI